jgi:hypothetical protein
MQWMMSTQLRQHLRARPSYLEGKKMLLLRIPIIFATGTPTLVKAIRRDSAATLLLYQELSKTEGADVPHVIMKPVGLIRGC